MERNKYSSLLAAFVIVEKVCMFSFFQVDSAFFILYTHLLS